MVFAVRSYRGDAGRAAGAVGVIRGGRARLFYVTMVYKFLPY